MLQRRSVHSTMLFMGTLPIYVRPLDALGISIGVGLVCFIVGLFIIRFGRRGRRLDDHPVCRRCGFDLTGAPASSDRCPECGASIREKRSIVIGNRKRRLGIIFAGSSVIAIGLLVGTGGSVHFSRQVDWLRLKPTWWLFHDATTALFFKQRADALVVLEERASRSELSPEQYSRFMEILVTTLSSSTPLVCSEWLSDHILYDHAVTPAQQERFFCYLVSNYSASAVTLTAGDPTANAFVTLDRYGFKPSPSWNLIGKSDPEVRRAYAIDRETLSAAIDGFPVQPGTFEAVDPSQSGESQWDQSVLLQGTPISKLAVGEHQLIVRLRVTGSIITSTHNAPFVVERTFPPQEITVTIPVNVTPKPPPATKPATSRRFWQR